MELAIKRTTNGLSYTKQTEAFITRACKRVWQGFRVFCAYLERAQAAAFPDAATAREAANMRAKAAIERHGNAILRAAYSYLHNMADAEDILQDTLVQMLKAAPAFESATHEKAWLLRVAINLCKNRLKRESRHRTEVLDDELAQRLAVEEQPDLAFVWDAVKALPEAYRAVVHLFYQEGYATAEIAQILGQKEATVRSHLHRARQSLKTTLREVHDFA